MNNAYIKQFKGFNKNISVHTDFGSSDVCVVDRVGE